MNIIALGEFVESNLTIKQRIKKLKASAKNRGIKVRLMEHEYVSLLNTGCIYYGKDLFSENGYCLDRLESNKGYTLYNVVPCCKVCNFAKETMSFNDFMHWLTKVINHREKVMALLKKVDFKKYSYQKEKEAHKDQLKSYKIKKCIKIG